jgi:tol-pal system protein YbgF
LLQAIDNRGDQIEQVLKRVVTRVKAVSKNQQEPWMEGSIDGEFCFGNCLVTVIESDLSDDRALWDSVKDSRDVNEIGAYLEKFPTGLFAGVARARVATFVKDQTPTSNSQTIFAESGSATSALAIQLPASDFVHANIDGIEVMVKLEEKIDWDKAIALFRQGDFVKTQMSLNSFVLRYPFSAYLPSALYWLGNAQYAAKDYQESMATFQKILKTNPTYVQAPKIMLTISTIYFELRDISAAREIILKLIKIHPQSEEANIARDRLSRIRNFK